MRYTSWVAGAVWLACLGGCASMCRETGEDAGPRTLLKWAHEKDEEPEKEPEAKPDANGNGNGEKAAAEAPKPKPDRRTEEPLVSDRPDFTEASSTVGKGRIQLEAGYTYTRDRSDGVTTNSHSYPEALLRIGAITDWLEFRVGQNFGNVLSDTFTANGADDLYLGVKIGLTEQSKWYPETALILQMQVPSGADSVSSGKVLPGFNFLYSWDIIKDRLSLAGSFQANQAVDGDRHSYLELAQSLSIGYGLTEKLGAYTEWFAFYPTGAVASGVTAQHYLDGGFTYSVTPNFQLDIRAGIGLTRSADDYFAGAGFVVRY